jgi:beta-phosphoglucomutase
MQNTIKAVIFDMDGVMLDNNDWHLKAWLAYAEKRSIPLKAEEAYTRVFGKTNKEIILEAYPDTDEKTIEEWSLEKEALYREMYEPDFALADGLKELLFQLKDRNYQIALASNAPKENVDFTLDKGGIRSFFDVILWAGVVQRPKPFPDIYQKASQLLGREASESLVVEDSPTGIMAAIAAESPVIGLSSTYTREKLRLYTPLVLDSLTEIPSLLFPPTG